VKKTYFILLVFIFSCSSGEENGVDMDRDKKPLEIKLSLEQVWWSKVYWNKESSSIVKCESDRESYMLSKGWSSDAVNFYGLDTLHIDLENKSGISVAGIDFNMENPSGEENKTHPQYIKYIKVDNSEGKSLILNKGYLEHSFDQKIIYFDSNLSDEALKSMLKSTKNVACPSEDDASNTFQKSTVSLASIKNLTSVIPYNDTNNKIKVGDIYQRHDVTGKEIIYY